MVGINWCTYKCNNIDNICPLWGIIKAQLSAYIIIILARYEGINKAHTSAIILIILARYGGSI